MNKNKAKKKALLGNWTRKNHKKLAEGLKRKKLKLNDLFIN